MSALGRLGLPLGVLLLIGAWFVPVERIDGGGVTLGGFWVAMLGIAVLVEGLVSGSAWRRCGRLAVLLLLGTAAQLDLTAPTWLQFLDLRPETLESGTSPLAAAVLMLQGVGVLLAARGRLRAFADALRSLLTPRIALVAGVLFVLAAAHATVIVFEARKDPSGLGFWTAAYAGQLGALAGLLLLNVTHVACIASEVPATEAAALGDRLAAWISLPGQEREATRADRRLPWVLAAWVLLAATSIAWAVFERVPHIPDGVAYLFQASGFAQGVLSAPAPPSPASFDCYLIVFDGAEWHAPTNPGWPAVLGLGVLLGVPWLVNAVLGALCIPLVHTLVERLADRGTAHVFALLCAASPWYVYLAASHMTHTLSLFLLLGCWVLLRPREGAPGPLRALMAGGLLGYMVLVRPLDGLVVGVLTGVWLLFVHRAGILRLASYSAGCVLGALWLFPFNAHFSGHPLKDPMNRYLAELWYPGANRLGFGADVGNPPGGWGILDPLEGHGAFDVVLNANQNVYNVNFELHGWAVGSLLLIAIHWLFGRRSRVDRWFAWFCGTLLAAYSCYWFSGGPDFGARYWFLVFVPCVWWTVQGLRTTAGLLRDRFSVPDAGVRVGVVLGVLVLVTATCFFPWRSLGRYVGYRKFHGQYRQLLEDGRLGNALVFVETDAVSDYGSAMLLNTPRLEPDRPIFARAVDEETDRRLAAAYPGRAVIRLQGPSITGGRVRIIAGGADE